MVAATEANYNELMDRIQRWLGKLQTCFNDLISGIAKASAVLTVGAAAALQEKLEWLRGKINDLVSQINGFLADMGEPYKLQDEHDRLETVYGEITSWEGTFKAGNDGAGSLLADNVDWSGPAGENYRQAVGDQHFSLKAYGETVTAVRPVLKDCADAIMRFMSTLAAALVGAVTAGIAAVAVALVTPVTAPVALAGFVSALAGAAALLVNALSDARETMGSAATVMSGEASSNGGFSAGHWSYLNISPITGRPRANPFTG